MIVFLQLTIAGGDVGPFDIYTDSDNYATAVQSNVTRQTLVTGFNCVVIPDDATIIRVTSTGECKNSDDAIIGGLSPLFYLHRATADDYEFKTIACSEDINISYYTQNGSISIGVTIYLESSLTTPLTGDPLRWIKIGEDCVVGSCGIYYVCQVNESGVIEDAVLCSSIIGTTHLGDYTDYVGSLDCCNQSDPIEYFYSIDGSFDVSDVVYTDEACTIPYVGNDHNYHKIEYQGGAGNFMAMRINHLGVIQQTVPCY